MLRGSAFRSPTNRRVPHISDFLQTLVGSVRLMRLSLQKGAHAVLQRSMQEIRGILLVFREMWDTTDVDR